MIGSLKRKRIERERQQGVNERQRAGRDFLAAVREVEGALEAIKAANNKVYRAEYDDAQPSMNQLRQARERMFQFVAAKDVVAEAPLLARLLGVQVAPTQSMPLPDWLEHIGRLELAKPETKDTQP